MIKHWLVALCVCFTLNAWAQSNLEINTPAVTAIRTALKERFAQLEPHFNSGAVGLTRDGLVELRDVAQVPLAQRATINALVSAQNKDRTSLYKEIAKANNHPEWEGEIARTFGARWIDRARPGWWVQDERGTWVKK